MAAFTKNSFLIYYRNLVYEYIFQESLEKQNEGLYHRMIALNIFKNFSLNKELLKMV